MMTKEEWDELTTMRFANTSILAANEEIVKEKYNDRRDELDVPENLPLNASDVPVEMYKVIPQSHPFWLAFRDDPRITGSVMAEYLLFMMKMTAPKLKIPKSMFQDEENSRIWTKLRLRIKHGSLPRDWFGQPGCTFASWGKKHELNCEVAVLDALPGWKCKESGLIIVTDDMIAKRGVYDVLNDNKPLGHFPIQLGDSPDGLLYGPDEHTGKIIYRAAEFKTGTQFLPLNGKKYPMCQFFMRPMDKMAPYDAIKSYYLPQCFMHMLALEVDECLFCSWTYNGGMNIWNIKFDLEYMSLILSMVKHLYETFILKDKDVPNNYFYNVRSARVAKAYNKLVEMTYAKITETKPYKKVPGDMTRVGCDNVVRPGPISTYLFYPDIAPEFPPFMKLNLYALAFELYEKVDWVSQYEHMDTRRSNIKKILKSHFFMFSETIVKAIADAPEFGPEKREIDLVQNHIIERQEIYLLFIFEATFNLIYDRDRRRMGSLDVITTRIESEWDSIRNLLKSKLLLPNFSRGGGIYKALDEKGSVWDSKWTDNIPAVAKLIVSIAKKTSYPKSHVFHYYQDPSIFVNNMYFDFMRVDHKMTEDCSSSLSSISGEQLIKNFAMKVPFEKHISLLLSLRYLLKLI